MINRLPSKIPAHRYHQYVPGQVPRYQGKKLTLRSTEQARRLLRLNQFTTLQHLLFLQREPFRRFHDSRDDIVLCGRSTLIGKHPLQHLFKTSQQRDAEICCPATTTTRHNGESLTTKHTFSRHTRGSPLDSCLPRFIHIALDIVA